MIPVCEEVTYVLKLENNNWYVGKSKSLHHRLTDHFSGEGAKWTKIHRPIEVKEIRPGNYEKETTLEYMGKYGIEVVRGFSWCQPTLSKYGMNNILSLLDF
jgi:hypothetical protein